MAVVEYGVEVVETVVARGAPERMAADLGANMRQFFLFMRDHPAGAPLLRGAGGVPEVADLIAAFRDRTVDLAVEVLPEDARSAERLAAIHRWNGVNETLIVQLKEDPTLSTEWAAWFSQSVLMSLLTLSDRNASQTEAQNASLTNSVGAD